MRHHQVFIGVYESLTFCLREDLSDIETIAEQEFNALDDFLLTDFSDGDQKVQHGPVPSTFKTVQLYDVDGRVLSIHVGQYSHLVQSCEFFGLVEIPCQECCLELLVKVLVIRSSSHKRIISDFLIKSFEVLSEACEESLILNGIRFICFECFFDSSSTVLKLSIREFINLRAILICQVL